MSITQRVCVCVCVCVFVTLGIQHATRMPYCHLWPSPLYSIFPLYLINCMIFENKLLNIKYVFRVSPQPLSETVFILKGIQRDIIENL